MQQSIGIQKIARLLQKVLGEIFVQESSRLFDNMIITVTEVRVSPDLELAKIYLSFLLTKDSRGLLKKIEQHKGVLRKRLGNRLRSKLRKVPELRFYKDDSAAYAADINQLIDGLGIPADTDCIVDV